MSIAFDNRASRPSPSEIESAAHDLVRRRGGEVLATARRYSFSHDDAEDAYQRALEILLTKAPSTREDELLPWLKTVVRHEAYALRKRRERDVPVEHDALDAWAGGDGDAADERIERYDRLRIGAEALGRLKPQETRALLLKAEGLSYDEIAAQTGWTFTKVNRCLTEGRRAFFARVEGIESGAECERMAPLLSAFADGEATAEDVAMLRPHVRGCASCRATLRGYRELPRAVAGVAPLPVAAGGMLPWLVERVESVWGSIRTYLEGAAATKATAVAASSVAIAGGGAATVNQIEGPADPERAAHSAPAPKRAAVAARAAGAPAAAQLRAAGAQAAGSRKRTATRPATGAAPVTLMPAPAADPRPDAATPAAAPAARPAAKPDPAPEPPTFGEFGP